MGGGAAEGRGSVLYAENDCCGATTINIYTYAYVYNNGCGCSVCWENTAMAEGKGDGVVKGLYRIGDGEGNYDREMAPQLGT